MMTELRNVIPFRSEGHEIEIVLARGFQRDAKSILTHDELNGFLNFIAARPDEGKVIPGTHGLRKIRWAAKGQGKSGGARVVYYFRDLNMPLYIVAIFAKGEKSDLTKAQYRDLERKLQLLIERSLEARGVAVGFSA